MRARMGEEEEQGTVTTCTCTHTHFQYEHTKHIYVYTQPQKTHVHTHTHIPFLDLPFSIKQHSWGMGEAVAVMGGIPECAQLNAAQEQTKNHLPPPNPTAA